MWTLHVVGDCDYHYKKIKCFRHCRNKYNVSPHCPILYNFYPHAIGCKELIRKIMLLSIPRRDGECEQ